MNKLIAIISIGFALCATASTQTSKEYVDKKDAITLTNANAYTEGRVAEVERRIPTADTFLPAEWTNGTSVVIGNGSSASGGVNTVVGSGSVAQGVGASAFGEIYVAAPDEQKSAMSHSVTISHPVKVRSYDFPVPVKAAMAAMGWGENFVRLPLTPMEDAHAEKLYAIMRQFALI